MKKDDKTLDRTAETKPAKKAKKVKVEKQFPAKKLPSLFKKSYTEKKLNSKILKKLYVPKDKTDVESLFEKGANPKKPELLAVSMDRTFTKKELKRFEKLAKDIKSHGLRIKFIPLAAVAAFIFAVFTIVMTFKNPITRKILKNACEGIFGAKTDIAYVNLEIFGTSLTVHGLAIGDKDHEFKNLFEAEKIEVSFSLVQALRKRFDAKNLEVTGMKFGTERKTSCKLPEKPKKPQSEEESAFVKSLKAKSENAVKDLKNQAFDMLGGSSPEEIVANLQAQLKTPAASLAAKSQAEEMIAKWKAKPEEIKTQVNDFSATVKALQKINSKNMKNPAEIKATIEKVQKAIEESKKLQAQVKTVTNEVKEDSKKIQTLSTDLKKAVESDTKLAREKIGSAVDAVKNAKQIFNKAMDTVGYNMLGQYYPYVKIGLSYAQQIKASQAAAKKSEPPKKERKENSRRLKGRTIQFWKDRPAFLIENVKASGPNFRGTITDISSNQDLWGKPMKAVCDFELKDIEHHGGLVMDTRSTSKAALISGDYSGKGFNAKVDGSKIAKVSGIPSVSGTAGIKAKFKVDPEFFEIGGSVDLNPVTLTSDGFSNEMVTRYYQEALSAVTRLSMGFDATFSKANGVNLDLSGNFGDQFAKALKAAAMKAGQDAKNAAFKKINEQINSSSNEALLKVKEFMGIEGDIDVQNTNLDSIQKTLEAKKVEFEKQLKEKAANAVTEKVSDKIGVNGANALKGLLKR